MPAGNSAFIKAANNMINKVMASAKNKPSNNNNPSISSGLSEKEDAKYGDNTKVVAQQEEENINPSINSYNPNNKSEDESVFIWDTPYEGMENDAPNVQRWKSLYEAADNAYKDYMSKESVYARDREQAERIDGFYNAINSAINAGSNLGTDEQKQAANQGIEDSINNVLKNFAPEKPEAYGPIGEFLAYLGTDEQKQAANQAIDEAWNPAFDNFAPKYKAEAYGPLAPLVGQVNGVAEAYDLIEPKDEEEAQALEEALAVENMSLGEAYDRFFDKEENKDLALKYGRNIGRLSAEAEDIDTWRRVLEDDGLRRFYADDYANFADGADTFTDEQLQRWYDTYKPTDTVSILNSGETSRNYGFTDAAVQDAFINYLYGKDPNLYYPGDSFVNEYGTTSLGDLYESGGMSGFFNKADDYINLLKYENAYNMFKDFADKGEAEKWSDQISDDDLARMLAFDALSYSTEPGDDKYSIDTLTADNPGMANTDFSVDAMNNYKGVPFTGMADIIKALAQSSGKDYYYSLYNPNYPFLVSEEEE